VIVSRISFARDAATGARACRATSICEALLKCLVATNFN
jgi:hypothetical protein